MVQKIVAYFIIINGIIPFSQKTKTKLAPIGGNAAHDVKRENGWQKKPKPFGSKKINYQPNDRDCSQCKAFRFL